MKHLTITRIAALALLLAAPLGTRAQQSEYADLAVDALWSSANEAYAEKRFAEAAELYTRIAEMGYSSAELYYNTGNAYFKAGQNDIALLRLGAAGTRRAQLPARAQARPVDERRTV
jgi:tetratricopeptide (TPR) repeat protein